jgi:antirestriction protein ArdC
MTTTTIQSTNNNNRNTVGVPPTTPEAHQRADRFNFNELLNKALTEPGIISEAYSRFHRYSLSNQILAVIQLQERGMPLSPIASYKTWQKLGRTVQKGQKALALFMPLTIQMKECNEVTGEEATTGKAFTRFALKRNWFSLDQTEGSDFEEPLAIPSWDAERALERLSIEECRFDLVNGNVQGYAFERSIAINPVAALPHKTRFHELAHVVLGHTGQGGCFDTETLSRHLEEVEAEAAAYMLCALLGMPGLNEARGYIQGWLGGQLLPEKSAKRIFGAVQTILAAGKPE